MLQALSQSSSSGILRAQAAILRDRWVYFVRQDALEAQLQQQGAHAAATSPGAAAAVAREPAGKAVPLPTPLPAAAGALRGTPAGKAVTSATAAAAVQPAPEVARALTQLHDACEELQELLDGLAATIQKIMDSDATAAAAAPGAAAAAPSAAASTGAQVWEGASSLAAGAGSLSALQDLLSRYECAEEMEHLQQWLSSSSSGGTACDASADNLLEHAWRLSFTPLASTGLAAALGVQMSGEEGGSGGSRSSRERSSGNNRGGGGVLGEALTATDLGMRLELALEQALELRSRLGARLALVG